MNQNRSLLALPRLSVLFTAGVLAGSAHALQAAPAAGIPKAPPAPPALDVVKLAPATEAAVVQDAQEARPQRLRVLRLDGDETSAPGEKVILRRPVAPVAAGAMAQESGFLGVQLGAESEGGAAISGTVDGSAAAGAGFQAGDVIVEVDDQEVADIDSLRTILRGTKAGQTIEVELLRGGERVEVEVQLGSRSGGAVARRPEAAGEADEADEIEEVDEVQAAPAEGGQRIRARLMKPGSSYRVLRVDGDGNVEKVESPAGAPSRGFFFDERPGGDEHDVRVEVEAQGEGDGDVRLWVNGEEVDPGEAGADLPHGVKVFSARGLDALAELKALENVEIEGLEGLHELENIQLELRGLEGLEALQGLHGMQEVDVKKLPGNGVHRQMIVRKRGDGGDEDVQVWVDGEKVEGGELPHGVHVFGDGEHTFEWIGDDEVQGLLRARIHGDGDEGEDITIEIDGREVELPVHIGRHMLKGMGEDGGAWVGRVESGDGPGIFTFRGGPDGPRARTFVRGMDAAPEAAQLRRRVEAMEGRIDRMERAIDELRASMNELRGPTPGPNVRMRRGPGASGVPAGPAGPDAPRAGGGSGPRQESSDSELRRELRDVMRAIERLERRERRDGGR